MSHALTEQLGTLGTDSCQIVAHVKHICYMYILRTPTYTITAAAASSVANISPGTKILLVIIAVLLAAVAALLVGVLGHEGNVRKSVLRGLYVFGGAVVGCVLIEGALGLL